MLLLLAYNPPRLSGVCGLDAVLVSAPLFSCSALRVRLRAAGVCENKDAEEAAPRWQPASR